MLFIDIIMLYLCNKTIFIMKKEIFLQYMDAISNQWNIEKDFIVSGSKRKDHVEARQMLYYLCSERGMRLSEIQRYMADQGYDPKHCPIHRGIKKIKQKMEEDRDYKTIASRISNSIFI